MKSKFDHDRNSVYKTIHNNKLEVCNLTTLDTVSQKTLTVPATHTEYANKAGV